MNEKSYGTVHLTDRKTAELTGIKSVDSFDEFSVCLTVSDTSLVVEGEQLHITELDLDKGKVAIKGQINAVVYSDLVQKRKGVLSGLFGAK